MLKFSFKYLVFITLLFLIAGRINFAQDTLLIKGRVIGKGNIPISGVSISLEGVSIEPVVTDENGTFEIRSPSGQEWLHITPTDSFKPMRVLLNHRNDLTIVMTPENSISGYDEIVNLYKSDERRNFISSFNAPTLKNKLHKPYETIDQHLQGTISGNFATGHSGMPGSGMVSYIRGIKSINTNNQPLYIIDGNPVESPGLFHPLLDGYSFNPLTSLDPRDISSLTVIKDYSASTSYGLIGSNGLILIETLRPDEVKTTINFSLRTGMSFSPKPIPQLNASQYKVLSHELLVNSGEPEENFMNDYPGLFANKSMNGYYKYMHETHWQNEIFQNSMLKDIYFNIKGGDQIARYGLSVGYLNHQGIIKKTGYERFNIRFVGDFNIFKWLKTDVTANLNFNTSNLKESAKIRQTSPILTSLFKAPLMGPFQYDEDGNQLTKLEEPESLGISNPAATISEFQAINKSYRFFTSFRITGDLSRQLKWHSFIGLNFNSMNENIFMPNHGMELYYSEEAFNVAKSLKDYLFSIYNDNYLIYHPDIGNQHNLNFIGGFRITTNTFEEDWGIAKNSHENDEYRSLQSGISYLREVGGESTKWNRLSTYLNCQYSYLDKYFIHASVTGVASSRVGVEAPGLIKIGNVPFGLFYSGGLAWRLSNENFLSNQIWIDNLMLRVTYGKTGNDDIGNYNALSSYHLVHYRETSGMVPTSLPNKSLKFETLSQLSSGIDLSTWGNSLNISLDWFRIITSDMLVYDKLDSYMGYTFQPVNNGTLLNEGWELSFSKRVLTTTKIHWNLGFNLSSLQNKVLHIKNNQIITPFLGGEYISKVGEPLLNFYGYVFEGVFSTSKEAANANLKTEKGLSFGAGDSKYKDLSGPDGKPDGIIDNYDKTILGSPIPDFYGGFTSNFSFKNWSFEVGLQFVLGREVYNYLRNQNEQMTGLVNQSTNVLNRWQYEGQKTNVPRAVWNDPLGNAAFSSRWIENGDFVRVKNLTVSYSVPGDFLVFRNAEFFATGINLITFSNYLGYDPEFSYSYSTMEQGIDYGLMPVPRQIILGIKLGL